MTTALTVPTRTRPRFHPLRVSGVERLTEQSVAISLEVPAELTETFRFEPGQHLTLRREVDGRQERRSYSICWSRPEALRRGALRIGVATVPGGRISTWLNQDLAVGDTLEVMPPTGSFTCPADPGARRHHVAIAAGSGITPVLSLLATALEEEPGSRATLLLGNRRADTVMFLEELEDLKNRYRGRFHLVHVLSREPLDAELLSGRLDRERLERLLDGLVGVETGDEWYLCGPYGLVETAQELLHDRGVDRRHVHHEIFHVEGAAPVPVVVPQVEPGAPPEATVRISLDGRSTEIPMPSRAETILAATLRERPDAPYSCTGGVCGTCRARVVAGEVRMERNYALEAEEVEAGIVLACQAHPVSERVVLDYDA